MVIEAERLEVINKAIEGLKSHGLPESVIKGLESWRDKEMSKPPARWLTESDLIELCSFIDKLDATGHEVYALQFNEHLEDLARGTGLSIQEIKNHAREYREGR